MDDDVKRYGKEIAEKQKSETFRCQNCLKIGHFTFKCQKKQKYRSRLTKSQLLEKKYDEMLKRKAELELKKDADVIPQTEVKKRRVESSPESIPPDSIKMSSSDDSSGSYESCSGCSNSSCSANVKKGKNKIQ
ncbi:hypothetical protein A3Q56_00290 [Intoshia linei]|uniref:CCHC-type domain-containing protein n=1 Tax=Intoshia linei TaxID=1819745 RepID=A0A177BDZ7_9BILA|nr:hypothetical protein A3Q56_00290 [Intoshia linei]